MHCLKKNNLFLARLPGKSVIPMKIIDIITSRLLLIFSEISKEILNFRKIYSPSSNKSRVMHFQVKAGNKSLTWCTLQRSCEQDDGLSSPPPHTICWCWCQSACRGTCQSMNMYDWWQAWHMSWCSWSRWWSLMSKAQRLC